MTDHTMKRINTATAVERAVSTRNFQLIEMRKKTSPLGLMIARYLKEEGGTKEFYLNHYAQRLLSQYYDDTSDASQRHEVRYEHKKYNFSFVSFNYESFFFFFNNYLIFFFFQIALEGMRGAGRASQKCTIGMRIGSTISKMMMMVQVGVSIYRLRQNTAWRKELTFQIWSWIASIVGAELGARLGVSWSPFGGVLDCILGAKFQKCTLGMRIESKISQMMMIKTNI